MTTLCNSGRYAAGATIQILLFGILAIEVKRKAPTAHTVLEIISAPPPLLTHSPCCMHLLQPSQPALHALPFWIAVGLWKHPCIAEVNLQDFDDCEWA